jgi:hypothetical protein
MTPDEARAVHPRELRELGPSDAASRRATLESLLTLVTSWGCRATLQGGVREAVEVSLPLTVKGDEECCRDDPYASAPDHHEAQEQPAATQVDDLTFQRSAGAVFEVPVWAISFLSKKRKGGAGNAQALHKAREARELAVVSTKSSAN